MYNHILLFETFFCHGINFCAGAARFFAKGRDLMPESETFSALLEQETQKWIDEEISKGNDAWNARRSFDGFSNIHWDMVAQSAAQIKEHLACSGQNMTRASFCAAASRTPPGASKKRWYYGRGRRPCQLQAGGLQPWPSCHHQDCCKNLKRRALRTRLREPGTAWDSILKRDVAYRRAGNRRKPITSPFC